MTSEERRLLFWGINLSIDYRKVREMLKHNLEIRTFVGTSENAVSVQIWTALSPDPFSHTDLFDDPFGLYRSRNLP